MHVFVCLCGYRKVKVLFFSSMSFNAEEFCQRLYLIMSVFYLNIYTRGELIFIHIFNRLEYSVSQGFSFQHRLLHNGGSRCRRK